LSIVDAGSRSAVSGTSGVSAVDICICTYHRPAVAETLRSIARQNGCNGVSIRVIVADNADEPCARELIEESARELALDATYVHAPSRNISIARNACLDAGSAEWLAFLDDDETASPNWLSSLIDEATRGHWDAVLGPVQAVYSQSAPSWIRAGDFHSTQPVFVRGRIETGYTGNVLIRRATIARERLRFRIELGRSGGEDEDFFNRLRDAGGRIGFAANALAYETIPEARTTLGWLLRRNFRAGQTYGARLRAQSGNALGRSRALAIAAAKASICAVGALVHLPLAMRRNRFLTRAALHCGVVARVAGVKEVKLY
jgi:succinoglycan biosynthesis protein ExoM